MTSVHDLLNTWQDQGMRGIAGRPGVRQLVAA
jgi:hypothetical protein